MCLKIGSVDGNVVFVHIFETQIRPGLPIGTVVPPSYPGQIFSLCFGFALALYKCIERKPLHLYYLLMLVARLVCKIDSLGLGIQWEFRLRDISLGT